MDGIFTHNRSYSRDIQAQGLVADEIDIFLCCSHGLIGTLKIFQKLSARAKSKFKTRLVDNTSFMLTISHFRIYYTATTPPAAESTKWK